MRTAIPGVVCWLLASGGAVAACDNPVPVRFPAGASATDLRGGVARGERDCFSIGARQGQIVSVTQPGVGHPNIAIQLYRPPWHVGHDADAVVVTGTALKGAGEGADATQWRGSLPVSGSYLLVVGTIRGGDAYRVHVEIH
jgi:hypothetical protein